jgi:NDP-sugar pyrophosphorylase family protein
MKAMVLAAGLGERMKPLTWDRAKPALPLLNRPSVLHLLEHLARNGVDQVAINLHYCPDTVRALEPEMRALGLNVFFSPEPTILGTGGGLKNAEEFLRDGTLIMANADFVTDCPLTLALEHHRRSGALATLVLTPFQEGTEYGAVEMGDDHRIVRIAGRPGPETGKPRYHFTGIHILEPAIFREIPPTVKSEINREIYPKLIERGERILGYVHAGFWRELGTPQRYLQGSLDLIRLGDAGYMQRMRFREGVYSASPLSSLQGSIEPAFLAGADLQMSSDSFAAEAVLGNRVVLGRRSRVVRSILWDGVRIEESSHLTECLVGAGVTIPATTSLTRRVVLDEASYRGDRGKLERSGSLLMASF